MAKFKNISGGVITFTLGENEQRMEHIIFPGEVAQLPEGNSYIASIEAQGILEKLDADEIITDVPKVGTSKNRKTN